jgi:hypothetical protein
MAKKKDNLTKEISKWSFTADRIKKAMSKHTYDWWAKKYLEFAMSKTTDGTMPFLTEFLRAHYVHCPPYIEVSLIKSFPTYSKLKELHRTVTKEFVIGKNIDKASFAAEYLKNEGEWDTDIKTDQKISINLTSFKLPPASTPKQIETSDSNIIDVSPIDSSEEDIIDADFTEEHIVEIAKKVKVMKKKEDKEQETFEINNKLTEMLDELGGE